MDSGRLSETTVATLSAFVPERDLRRMRALTSAPWRWLPVPLRMAAVTFGPFAIYRRGQFNETESWGLALIAHEACHIGQARELGIRGFFVRYLAGQFRCRFEHDRHAMEIPAIACQQTVRRELERET
jgi:hypothetical protein